MRAPETTREITEDEAKFVRSGRKERADKRLPSATAELIKYVMVELDVDRGNHHAFQEEMKSLVEIMFDLKKWELVFAAYPITCDINRFVHIWRIPDESSIVEVMREGALGSASDPGDALQMEFRECYQTVQAMIKHTRHTLMTSLPYDPAHVGFQTQTILVDVDGQLFLIDHDKLKTLSRLDISGALERTRKKQLRRRWTGKDAQQREEPALAYEGDAEAPALEPATDDLKAIQWHLNRGASVAKVKLRNEDCLLFNLASLKSKSVYQRAEPSEVASEPLKEFKTGAEQLDAPGGMLIAAPWGAVYQLKEDDLKGIAQGISAKGNTMKAVKPLIESNVPLAAIPEERDQLIGDGCACYVINLQSFRKPGK